MHYILPPILFRFAVSVESCSCPVSPGRFVPNARSGLFAILASLFLGTYPLSHVHSIVKVHPARKTKTGT
jgi:hypothetical protein